MVENELKIDMRKMSLSETFLFIEIIKSVIKIVEEKGKKITFVPEQDKSLMLTGNLS